MRKVYREYTKLCRAEGVDLMGLELGPKHCRLHFETGFIIAANSPSDWRNMKHVRSAIRRLHN